MTIDSPWTLGSDTTRRSIEWPSIVRLTRPSCGTRRSAMSRSDMIFTRLMTPETMRLGIVVVSISTPSMRKRTRRSLPSGSRWTSDAPCSTAWAMTWLTSLMTGWSSALSRRSTISAGPSSKFSSPPNETSSTTSSRRVMRLMRPLMSSRLATAARTSRPVMIAMSSIARTLAGSAIATSSVRSST